MNIIDCCDTGTLVLVKRIYQSNADQYDLKQCPDCRRHWLYRYLEDNWWDNLQLNQNDCEEWYIPLEDDELEQVSQMELSKIGSRDGYMHIKKVIPTISSDDWKRLRIPAEKPTK